MQHTTVVAGAEVLRSGLLPGTNITLAGTQRFIREIENSSSVTESIQIISRSDMSLMALEMMQLFGGGR
jgi:hypothetical protein